jgi:hypothetical protein
MNFVENIEKANPNFEVMWVNKKEYVESLPDDIEFYMNKAQDLLAYYFP